jgi:hypothetical protein
MALAKARRWLGAGTGLLMLVPPCVAARAQTPIGTVSTLDATVTGASPMGNDRALLGMNGTVVAKDHVAYVQLFRGGSVKVCATSGVHLTSGVPAAGGAAAAAKATVSGSAAPEAAPPLAPAPLMVALDRGAMELRMAAVPGDIVMTPDLRLSFSGEGSLDVHIRVTRNGDTCVENRVAGLGGHPELRAGSLFGSETYAVLPGQHVLFEGGSLREVVDNESSPCGCPEAPVKVPEAAAPNAAKAPAAQAEVQHPFPAAVSQGLAPAPPVPQAPPGVTHTQVATTLVYDPAAADAQAKRDAAAKPPAAAPPEKKGFFHSLGRFFRRLF